MKKRLCLATLLALALLLTAAFALADGLSVEPGSVPGLKAGGFDDVEIDAAPSLSEVPEGLAGLVNDGSGGVEIDALPSLSEALEWEGSAGSEQDDAANTSKPIPIYEPETYEITLSGDTTRTLMIGDQLIVNVPGKTIRSYKSSDEEVVSLVYDSDFSDCLNVFSMAVGKAKVTVKLNDGKTYAIAVTVKDPLSPVSLALTAKEATLRVGCDIDIKQWTRLQPVYAKARFSYASSDKSVARVGKDGVVRAMKPGKATVTVATKNGLKARLKLTVKANRTPALHAKPTARSARKLGVAWTLWPGSLEMKGDGSIACQLWLVNGGAGRLTALKNLELSVWQLGGSGETLIARKTFGKVEAACGKNRWKRVSLTFPASSIQCTVADFTKLTKKKLSFRLNGIPTAKMSYGYSPYMPTAIGIEGGTDGDNPVRYRALLVGETKFYWGDKPGNPDDWERIPAFYRDVEIMKATLERVKGPEGGRYQITCRKNTDLAELTRLIQTTFADADSNDVSLFYFSGHGNSSDEASDAQSGALVMASKEERHCEEMPMSTLRDLLLKVPGKVVVILSSCGSGAAVYKKNGVDPAQAARRFDEEAVNAFRSADPGLAANTGELRVMNKFYVITTAAYREEAWGESQGSFFAMALEKGVGRSGDMPADRLYAGNRNGVVDLHELYRYLSSTMDYESHMDVDGKSYYQHAQVYPSDVRYALFR